MDDAMLDGLTEEEIKALEELKELEEGASDDDPEVDLANGQDGGDGEGEGEEDEGNGEGSGEGDGGEEGADAGAGEGGEGDKSGADAGGADGQDGAGDEDAVLHAPLLVAEAPADAEARLQEIASKKAALVEAFDDGEKTAKEYQTELDALNKQEREIERALDKAQIAEELEEQRLENERQATINGFLKEHDIKRDPSDLKFVALDAAVRIVANSEEGQKLSARAILQKAFDTCIAQGVIQAKGAAKPQKEAKAEPKTEQKPEQKPAKKKIDAPKTLANVPASEVADTTDAARFASINRIKDPDARERAFLKLSPADQEAYLEMGG